MTDCGYDLITILTFGYDTPAKGSVQKRMI
ncbi:hypothetical protein LCGC14_1381010 [marine sediment metagenome]|uniref:Uncharacterized protein n=1 Tax=marine sediment metagenome TaxID=412755 RepID=A0A0F9N4F0_9ZZZZ